MIAAKDSRSTGFQPVGMAGVPPAVDVTRHPVRADTAGGTPAVPTGKMPVLRRLRRVARRLSVAAAVMLAALRLAWLLLPKPELLPPDAEFSHVVLDRDGRVLFTALTPDEKYRLPAKLA